MKEHNPALLPSGLIDLLPPEAAKEADAIQVVMKEFEAHGYDRVKPPLAEFEESLFAPGPGRAVAGETFRLMDPVSRRMMALRSDTTAQIARISATRLENESRPLRLAYAGEVLRVGGTQLRPQREFVKAGCELIGSHDIEADIEVSILALRALKALEIENITIDFALPPLIGQIYEACDTSATDRSTLNDCLERRDRDAISNHNSKAAELLDQLVGCMGPAEQALGKFLKLNLPEEARTYVEALSQIIHGVEKAVGDLGLSGIDMTLDPAERRGFDYQTGFAFTLFAKNVRGEIGRGGRYDINGDGSSLAETAAGFTFYMDTLRRVLPAHEDKKIKVVSAGEAWDKIAELQSRGFKVIRKLEKTET